MNPYAIIGALVLAIGLATGGYYTGWEKRGDHEAAITLKAQKDAKDAADKLLAAEKLRGDKLAVELETEKRNIKTVTIEVIKEIPKVTTVYVEVPGEIAKPIPPAVYTWGAVGMFNRALRPDLPNTASEFAYPPGATNITRAPVDTPEVLAVHAENAGKYADCRVQLNKLIDFELGRGKTPAPAQ